MYTTMSYLDLSVMSNDLQKFNSKYYSKHNFPEKFNSKNIQNLVFQKYSIQKLFKTFFSEIFNSKSYSFSDLWRNSIQKYYSKLDFFLDSIQKNIHSIPKKEYLPWLHQTASLTWICKFGGLLACCHTYANMAAQWGGCCGNLCTKLQILKREKKLPVPGIQANESVS